jgi:multimeric flavodoxin WrbA
VTTLLVVHHTPSPSVHSMLDAVLSGARDPSIVGVDVVTKAALAATAADVLHADGYLLGTPANLGYMSGALKHFFDTIYYPCLESTTRRPYGVFVHGNNDTEGALASIQKVVTGLDWRAVAEPVQVIGNASQADLDACFELGGVASATLTSA